MRKKISGEAGLTVVEMLAATLILILLALMLNTGLQMALRTYQTIIAQNEVELLLSSAVDALADDLRYARDVKEASATTISDFTAITNFTYTSDSFGSGTLLGVKDGQILAVKLKADGNVENSYRVLSTGAYGKVKDAYKAYTVQTMEIDPNYDSGEVTFTIVLTVTDGSISASTPKDGVTVRCLNKMKVP